MEPLILGYTTNLKSSLELAKLTIEDTIKLAEGDLDREVSTAIKNKMMLLQKHLNQAFPVLKAIRRRLFLLQPGDTPNGVRRQVSKW